MQKSKKITVFIIFLILIYGLMKNMPFITKINNIYLYIINPITWIIISVSLYLLLGRNIENKKLKNAIIEYTIIASLSYIIINMLSGLIVTFGTNANSTTLKGLLYNFWIFGVELILREYVRYKLINNVYDKEKSTIAIIISVVYIISDINLKLFSIKNITPLYLITYFLQSVLPNIAENILFSYMAIYSNYVGQIIYVVITNLYYWISPILPNSPWIMTTIIETIIPTILLLYIRYRKNKLDIFRTKENIINSDPRNIIPLVILIILAIWFAVGVFPIRPIAIATGSMEKELYVGDIAIIKKCNANDVNEGDIIQYQMEGYTVIHRIIEKKQKNGEFYFITKGDNNNTPDQQEVKEEQLIGKVIFKIRYIGYPAIWLHILQSNEPDIQVET